MYSLTDHVQAPSLLRGPDASRKCRCPVHHGGDDTLPTPHSQRYPPIVYIEHALAGPKLCAWREMPLAGNALFWTYRRSTLESK